MSTDNRHKDSDPSPAGLKTPTATSLKSPMELTRKNVGSRAILLAGLVGWSGIAYVETWNSRSGLVGPQRPVRFGASETFNLKRRPAKGLSTPPSGTSPFHFVLLLALGANRHYVTDRAH